MELPEGEREDEERVARRFGQGDGGGGDVFVRPLTDTVNVHSRPREQGGEEPAERELDALAEQVRDEQHDEAGEGEAERRPDDGLAR